MSKPSLIAADSLLAIDIGAVNTRSLLFDMVEGRYRFLAAGTAATTAGAPMHDASEGVRIALDELETIVGRKLMGSDERLITPSQPDGSGIDRVVGSLSAGEPLKTVALGLLDKVSLESALHLIHTSYAKVVDTISLNDPRQPEAQIDAILHQRPDLVVIAGGTDQGANRTVTHLIQLLGMALQLLPFGHQPEVFFAGNESLAQSISDHFAPLTSIHLAPNIRPSLEIEQLGPAEGVLAAIFRKIRSRTILGVDELNAWTNGQLLPTSTAIGRVIRFLSEVSHSRNVLGIDVGASSTTVAASFAGDLKLKVLSEHGVGEGLSGPLNNFKLEEVNRWIVPTVSSDYLVSYLHNKRLYPGSLPAIVEDLAIEQAVARQTMRWAMRQLEDRYPDDIKRPATADTAPWFDPILVGGSVIAKAPSLAQSLMMILDGVQPTGIANLILDKNGLTQALGAAAGANPLLAIQVLESNAFLRLGTVIAPVGEARQGTSILQIHITYDKGQARTHEVKMGSLLTIPLPVGQVAQLRLQPLQRFDIGMGPGRGGVRRVSGSLYGLVIDARGRPLTLPEEPNRRREVLQEWLWALER